MTPFVNGLQTLSFPVVWWIFAFLAAQKHSVSEKNKKYCIQGCVWVWVVWVFLVFGVFFFFGTSHQPAFSLEK